MYFLDRIESAQHTQENVQNASSPRTSANIDKGAYSQESAIFDELENAAGTNTPPNVGSQNARLEVLM